MELWIRSQDKNRLTKVDDLYIVHDDNNMCDYIGNNIVGHLAKYTKLGRALEVLDEIQKSLLPRGIIKTRMILNQEDIKRIRNIYEGQFDVVDNRIEEIQMSSTCYYEMPED